MKKKFLLFTLLLSALSMKAIWVAPNWTVFVTEDGAYEGYSYAEYFEMEGFQKITFSDGNMIITHGYYGKKTFALANILQMYYDEGGAYNVKQESVTDFFVWSPMTQELSVRCAAGTPIKIYSADGRLALTSIQTVTQAPLKLSSLPKGIYIAEAKGKTIKILR